MNWIVECLTTPHWQMTWMHKATISGLGFLVALAVCIPWALGSELLAERKMRRKARRG